MVDYKVCGRCKNWVQLADSGQCKLDGHYCECDDKEKIKDSENVDYLNKLKTKVTRVEREKNNLYNRSQKFKNALYREFGRDKYLEFQDKYDL